MAVHKLRPMEAIRCAATSCAGCGCSLASSPREALEVLARRMAWAARTDS